MNKTSARGKVVVCNGFDEEGTIVAGVAGVVMPDDFYQDVAFSFALPVSIITSSNQTDILNYLNSTRYLQNSPLIGSHTMSRCKSISLNMHYYILKFRQ